LDWMPKLSQFTPFSLMLETRKLTQAVQQEHQQLWAGDRRQNPQYKIFNDNRHEQHAFLWFTDISATKK
jgi:hypothetical protein